MPKTPIKPRKIGHFEIGEFYDKSTFHLPRQGERTTECVVKSRAELGIVRQS